METKCLDGLGVATFILRNQKSAHRMLPRARLLNEMSEAGQVGRAAERACLLLPKGRCCLAPVGRCWQIRDSAQRSQLSILNINCSGIKFFQLNHTVVLTGAVDHIF